MRMQSKEKELLPGAEEPNIRIATPLSRLQVSLIQESLRETGWEHSDFFVGSVSPGFMISMAQKKLRSILGS